MSTPRKSIKTRSITRAAAAKKRLDQAIAAHAHAFGEAQWTNGYRCGNKAKERDLFEREMAQWNHVSSRERDIALALRAYVSSVRAIAKAEGK